ncbi:MAG: ribonuclease P protein component 4 [Candidatus Nanohaloarchaea archaeon]
MQQEIARQRIKKLLRLASETAGESEENRKTERYVKAALDIGMKQNVSFPEEERIKICNECHSYLKPGLNCSVRLTQKNSCIIYRCERCQGVNRHGY